MPRIARDRTDPLWRLTPASSTLLKFARYLTEVTSKPVLDVGCGYGRNAVALALRGLDVVCADSDPHRLSTLTVLAPAFLARDKLRDQEPGEIRTICVDLHASTWRFEHDAFSSIVCVQFPDPEPLFDVFRASVVRAGFLYLETFGGHGENYFDLPRTGHLKRVLQEHYDIISYREKPVGPPMLGRVSAKLLARRL
jgi:SAM-dependent methyltransferase